MDFHRLFHPHACVSVPASEQKLETDLPDLAQRPRRCLATDLVGPVRSQPYDEALLAGCSWGASVVRIAAQEVRKLGGVILTASTNEYLVISRSPTF